MSKSKKKYLEYISDIRKHGKNVTEWEYDFIEICYEKLIRDKKIGDAAEILERIYNESVESE